TGNAGEQQVDQADVQLRGIGCSGNHLGKPAEDIEMVSGVTDLDLLQFLRVEGPRPEQLRGGGSRGAAVLGHGEGRVADDEAVTRLELEASVLDPLPEDRIAAARQ